jgi:hypothetical protein
MQYILRIILFSVVILSAACVNKPRYPILDEIADIDVDIPAILKQGLIKLDSSMYNVKYVLLETNENCLIGHASKVIITQDKILVADFNIAKSLFIYDLYGKFQYKISRQGNGPGEYISFVDFDVDTDGDIYIYDVFKTNFLVYDSMGYYKNTIKIDYQIGSFCIVGDNIYCSELTKYDKILANLAVFNIPNKNMDYILPSRKLLDHYRYIRNSIFKFYHSPQYTYYSPMFSPIIYSINENGVNPFMTLSNSNIPPKEKLLEWIDQPQSMVFDTEYFKEATYIYETHQYIFSTIKTFISINLLYDKHGKKYYPLNSFYTDIGISTIRGSTGDSFFGVMEPDPERHKELIKMEKVLQNWKDEDNPVIVFIDFTI